MKKWLGPFALSVGLAVGVDVASAQDKPGQHLDIRPEQMPAPYATPATANPPSVIPRPQGAAPEAPPGFKVSIFADGLFQPRFMLVAPNGDVFLTQPDEGKVSLLREASGKVQIYTFARGFDGCHGLALHDGAIYVGDRKAVCGFPMRTAR